MVQGSLKQFKKAGRAATRKKGQTGAAGKGAAPRLAKPAVSKVRNAKKVVGICGVEKLLVQQAAANREHLVYVQKDSKQARQPEAGPEEEAERVENALSDDEGRGGGSSLEEGRSCEALAPAA